jgi:DNA-binding NarL/FixJ family response regulator
VLLADHKTMFREGLVELLTSYGASDVVGETNIQVALTRRMKPSVVIIQVQMPFEKTKEALDRICAVEPSPKVVIVTMFEDPSFIRDLLKLGASGYVLKSSSSRHLIGTVRAAVFAPKEGNVVVGMPREMLEEAEGGAEGVISARELEILLLAAQGLSNRQIATRVHLTEGTVKRHLHNTYHKMGVGSRGEAVRHALLNEWITISDIGEEEASPDGGPG